MGRLLIFLLLAAGAVFLLTWLSRFSHRTHSMPCKGGMSVDEARRILGVSSHAGVDEIKEAHRRLIQKHHPDQGGSDAMAAKINLARDILLG